VLVLDNTSATGQVAKKFRPVQTEFLLAETQSTQRTEKKKNLICLCDLCGFARGNKGLSPVTTHHKGTKTQKVDKLNS